MEDTIASSYKSCASSFEAALANKDLEAEASSVPIAFWEDILVRLKLFAGNIGAHQVGQMSLDYRLREATHLRDRLLVTLSSIKHAIEDIDAILSTRVLSPDDGEFMSADERCHELRDVHGTLQALVSSLFQLSMTIRKPGRVQRLQRVIEEDPVGTSFLNSLDIRRIADNFPSASHVLRQRLAAATARRRATLKYLERRHQKLSKGINGEDDENESAVMSSQVATALVEGDLEKRTSRSEAGISETSFGTSLFSSETRRTIPPPPEASHNGQAFECPYCFYIIQISGPSSWARHVFRDLSPYVCPFEDCSIPGRLYESTRAWEGHIKQDHGDLFHDTRCLLCQEVQPRLNMNRHLARHLQDVALFVLPPSVLDDKESSAQADVSSTEADSWVQQGDSADSPAAEETILSHLGDQAAEAHQTFSSEDPRKEIPRFEGEQLLSQAHAVQSDNLPHQQRPSSAHSQPELEQLRPQQTPLELITNPNSPSGSFDSEVINAHRTPSTNEEDKSMKNNVRKERDSEESADPPKQLESERNNPYRRMPTRQDEDEIFAPLPPKLPSKSKYKYPREDDVVDYIVEERQPQRYRKTKIIHTHPDDEDSHPKVENPSSPYRKRESGNYVVEGGTDIGNNERRRKEDEVRKLTEDFNNLLAEERKERLEAERAASIAKDKAVQLEADLIHERRERSLKQRERVAAEREKRLTDERDRYVEVRLPSFDYIPTAVVVYDSDRSALDRAKDDYRQVEEQRSSTGDRRPRRQNVIIVEDDKDRGPTRR